MKNKEDVKSEESIESTSSGLLGCDKGYKDMCCCHCDYLLKIAFFQQQSNISKNLQLEGWVCILPSMMDVNDKICFFKEDKHGCCECFTEKATA